MATVAGRYAFADAIAMSRQLAISQRYMFDDERHADSHQYLRLRASAMRYSRAALTQIFFADDDFQHALRCRCPNTSPPTA